MKKIELHCHFDGSLNLEHANRLVGRNVQPEMSGGESGNLASYLNKFVLPLELLQTRGNLVEFARLLAEDLVKDGIIYAEIRFCPLLHVRNGLDLNTIVQSVLDGLWQVPEVKTNLILCMMRNLSFAENMQILILANTFKGRGVVALDLAGDEAKRTNSDPEFAELFRRARANGIPFTIHGGEADGPAGVDEAIKLGASRVGHGIRAIESAKTVKRLVEQRIPLEICMTSNFDTGVFDNIGHHPVRQLFDAGVPITINTDNRTVSNTTLTKEYAVLREFFGFTEWDLLACNLQAVLDSFADNTLQIQLCRELLDEYVIHHH